jgi:hypothetical protein
MSIPQPEGMGLVIKFVLKLREQNLRQIVESSGNLINTVLNVQKIEQNLK